MRLTLTALIFAISLTASGAAVPLATSMTTPAIVSTPTTPTTATAAHVLRDVRIRQLPDALRVILVFDRTAPYVVRRDDQQPRIWLDLINTRVEFLAPELSRILDDRLAGIWLRRQSEAMATLEFRFYSAKTKIQDFSLSDPPVVVLDISREDQPEYRVASAAAQTTSTGVYTAPGGPIVSARWLDMPETATVRIGAAATPSPITTATQTAIASQPATETLTVSAEAVKEEIQPIQADYDYFPVHRIEIGSQLGQESLKMFLDRRWGTAMNGEGGVLNKGLHYLESNPINKESIAILYMMAEARFQLGTKSKPRPFDDMINFYEQAIRAGDSGELGAFGHWRLGQIYREISNDQVAIEHLKEAMKSPEPVVRRRASLLAARAMIALKHNGDVLALLDSIDPKLMDGPTRVQVNLCRGIALVGANQHEAAWKAFEEATKVDAQWMHHEADALEGLIEASLKTGRIAEAGKYIEFTNDVFGIDRDDRRMRLLLLYAEVEAAGGDEQNAIEAYNQILVQLGKSPKGADVQKRLLAMHPEAVVRGEKNYCDLLWRRGEVQQAMAELDRAWKQCLREGIDTRSLESAARPILPAFMELAMQTGHPYDAMQGWRLYGHTVNKNEDRQRCFRSLVDSLEQLGLYFEALRTIKIMEDDGEPLSGPAAWRMKLQAARINYRLGDYVMAISRLEDVLAEPVGDDLRRSAYEYLARSYGATKRPLDAAQAWQLLATTPGVDTELLATSLTESGRLFLEAGMPMQAIELALKGLVHEKQTAEAGREPWSQKISIDLRLMLAQSYRETGDITRAMIAAEDLLARDELSPEVSAQVRLLLASCRQRLNQTREALAEYEAVAKDPNTPAPWRQYAQVVVNSIRWDLTHPNWKLDWKSGDKKTNTGH